MRIALLLITSCTVAACTFDPSGPGTAPDDATVGADARSVDANPRQPDANPLSPDATIAPFVCDPGNSDLAACYRFEGNTNDESSYGNHGSPTAISFDTGIDGIAMRSSSASFLFVPDSPSLDVSSLTVEAWVLADEINPPSGRSGIVDNGGQYGFFLRTGGELWCNVANPFFDVSISGSFQSGTWVHVACTYDGDTLLAYVDGTLVAQRSGGPAMSQASMSGAAIGANSPSGEQLVGMIDNLRIWRVVRTPAQICAAAGTC